MLVTVLPLNCGSETPSRPGKIAAWCPGPGVPVPARPGPAPAPGRPWELMKSELAAGQGDLSIRARLGVAEPQPWPSCQCWFRLIAGGRLFGMIMMARKYSE
jgi:hypothetical protein